jgi:hypothetical protein
MLRIEENECRITPSANPTYKNQPDRALAMNWYEKEM